MARPRSVLALAALCDGLMACGPAVSGPPPYDPACTFKLTKVDLIHSLKDYPARIRKGALEVVNTPIVDRGKPLTSRAYRFVLGGHILATDHWFIWFESDLPEYSPYMYIFTFDEPGDPPRIVYNGNNWKRKASNLCEITEGVDLGNIDPR